LGIEVAQPDNGIVISQRKYALDILKETRLMNVAHPWILMPNTYLVKASLSQILKSTED